MEFRRRGISLGCVCEIDMRIREPFEISKFAALLLTERFRKKLARLEPPFATF